MRTKLFALLCLIATPAWAVDNSCTGGCVNWNGAGFQSGTSAPGSTITTQATGHEFHIWFCGQGISAIGTPTFDGTAVANVGAVQANANFGQQLCQTSATPAGATGAHTIVVPVTGTCTSCTTIITEWANTLPMISQNANVGPEGPTTATVGAGNVTASGTGTANLETIYTTITAAGNPTNPSGLSTGAATGLAGISFAFQNGVTGTLNPLWTPNAGGDSYPTVLTAIFQTSSGGVISHQRLLKGVGG
jgi:hypothetical protein